MTYEERMIERLQKELETVRQEKAEALKDLQHTQAQARVYELKFRDAERRAYNAEQQAHLAHSAIKEMLTKLQQPICTNQQTQTK